MTDVIDYQLHGNDLQLIEIGLDPGEGVKAEVGAMMSMEEDINMETSTGGGILSGIKRKLAGEGFFITTFTNKGRAKRHVSFAAPFPGRIIPIDLEELGGSFLCQKDAFLCAAQGIDITVAFTKKIGAGMFGGEGFILQRLKGEGLAFVHAGGAIVRKELMPDETLRVDTGSLVAFSPSIKYSVGLVGGFRNTLFGGEGIFLATMTGPGTLYLQSLPFSRLVDRIAAVMPKERATR